MTSQLSLLSAPETPPKRKHVDLLELHAREKLGMPAEWRLFLYKCLPENGDTTQAFYLEGSIPTVHTKCAKKGKPNYRGGEKRAVAIISVAEQDAWDKQWHISNDACEKCHGLGDLVTSVSAIDGVHTKPCVKCNSTGKYQGAKP